MSSGLYGWITTVGGISVLLSRHTSHTRRWHWLHIRDSLTSSLFFFFSFIWVVQASAGSIVWTLTDAGPLAGPGQGKVWKVNLFPPQMLALGVLKRHLWHVPHLAGGPAGHWPLQAVAAAGWGRPAQPWHGKAGTAYYPAPGFGVFNTRWSQCFTTTVWYDVSACRFRHDNGVGI